MPLLTAASTCVCPYFHFTVSLTKVSANRPEAKIRLVENLQQAADKYDRAMIVRFDNMRTSALKELRASMPDSRLFMGKNRVMQVALCGGELGGEFRPGLSEFADDISGQVAVLFTNRTAEEVLDAFAMSEVPDFARAGTRASQTVVIPAGPLPTMPFTQVDTLNSLGMATSLQRGIVVSAGDHTVCEEGQVLSPEASRLLVCETKRQPTIRSAVSGMRRLWLRAPHACMLRARHSIFTETVRQAHRGVQARDYHGVGP